MCILKYKLSQWQASSMVEFLLGNLKTGQRFKSWHRQIGPLYNQIPVVLYKIKLIEIIQACGALASTINPAMKGTLVGGN